MTLEKLIEECNECLNSEFNFIPKKSQYFVIQSWQEFLRKTGSDVRAQGIFVPRFLSAFLDGKSQYLPTNLLHEYFGHGVFCEYTLTGQTIVNLDKKLHILEKEIFGDNLSFGKNTLKVNSEDQRIQTYFETKSELQKLFQEKHELYEGFAIWLEYYLAKLTKQDNLFNAKMEESVHPKYVEIFETFKNFSDSYGNFALISHLGFPKFYDNEIVVKTLNKLYWKHFNSIDFGIIYGSRKPYSDIDLFFVSDKIQSGMNHWFDLFVKTPEEFEDELSKLSIEITDPIFSGEMIIGVEGYQQALQKRVLDTPITQEAIQYNYERSKVQADLASKFPEGSKERKIAQSYQESFRRNAEELQKGNKILTLKTLHLERLNR